MNTGLDDRVIRNILKYRENGGKFRSREDLKKIWGLDSSEYSRIETYIIIKDKDNETSRYLQKDQRNPAE